MTRERPDAMPAYNRMLLGMDYAFGNTLTVTAELFFNGAGARDPSSYDCRRRSNIEPPCRPNIEPGVEANRVMVGCG
jgi:hypothetical protein